MIWSSASYFVQYWYRGFGYHRRKNEKQIPFQTFEPSSFMKPADPMRKSSRLIMDESANQCHQSIRPITHVNVQAGHFEWKAIYYHSQNHFRYAWWWKEKIGICIFRELIRQSREVKQLINKIITIRSEKQKMFSFLLEKLFMSLFIWFSFASKIVKKLSRMCKANWVWFCAHQRGGGVLDGGPR